MTSQYIEVSKVDHVTTLTLSNPPRHTINAAGSQALCEQLEELANDKSVRVVMLTGGSDDIFVRHYEVGELASSAERMVDRQPPARPSPRPNATRREQGLRGAMLALERMDAITIAAINGMAHGGGLELALACDFRLARSGPFTLGLPETSVGILPGGGGTQRFARLLGVAKALDLILHGTVMESETALELGIVSRVLPEPLDNYRHAAHDFAQVLASRAPRALANAKRAIREGVQLDLKSGLRREAELFAELMATEDAALALRAVFEGKRPPKFKGR